jgi:hypothetical protein
VSRGILTMAYGGVRYRSFAVALARSLQLHSPGVPRAVVVDGRDRRLGPLYAHRVRFDPARGAGLLQKLWLPEYSPFDETIFIDADSLLVRDLAFMWRVFEGRGFAVVGATQRSDGEWWGDIAARCRRFGLQTLPAFNGGLYYFDRGPESAAVFAEARNLAARYDELGFARLSNGSAVDEALFSVAIALHAPAAPVEDHGRAMRTPLRKRGDLRIDVLRGHACFVKEGQVVEPAIVHFASYSTTLFDYRRECLKLALVAHGIPAPAVSAAIDKPAAAARALVRAAWRRR